MKECRKLSLGCYPTPLVRLTQIEKEYGLKVPFYIKREDLSGMGPGGSKIRSLEYLLAEAQEQGCRRVIAAGSCGSDLCTSAAAAARSLGMTACLFYNCAEPVERRGNMLLNKQMGAEEVFLGPITKADRDRQAEILANIFGPDAYLIKKEGSSGLGLFGYADMVTEMEKQFRTMSAGDNGKKLARIFVPGENEGMAAGMVLGNILLGEPFEIKIISLEDEKSALNKRMEGLLIEAFPFLTAEEQGIFVERRKKGDIFFISDPAGEEEPGIPATETQELARKFSSLTGIFIEDSFSAATLQKALEETEKKQDLPGIFVYSEGAASLFAQ